jgi:hypothetical protein
MLLQPTVYRRREAPVVEEFVESLVTERNGP